MVPTPGSEYDLDAEVEKALAQNTPNVSLPDGCRETKLLEIVAIHNRLDLAKKLLDAGGTLTADEFASVIWWWCGAGMAVLFLERDTPFNDKCVAFAARHERWETMFALVDYGANKETTIDEGATLLHAAIWAGDVGGSGAAAGLLQRGANPNRRDTLHRTPLMLACDRYHPVPWNNANIQDHIEDLLLESGADVNAQTPWSETALLLCVGPEKQAQMHRRRTVQKLLKAGADPNAVSNRGTTALMFAARDNDAPLVRLLLNAGANPAITTPNGETARDIAKRYGSKTVWRLLGEKQAKTMA